VLDRIMSLLCGVMITGTVTCTGTNCEDVACAGQNYVANVMNVKFEYFSVSVKTISLNIST
jgi:hypothetical protein